jgi:hypothetical protein
LASRISMSAVAVAQTFTLRSAACASSSSSSFSAAARGGARARSERPGATTDASWRWLSISRANTIRGETSSVRAGSAARPEPANRLLAQSLQIDL